MDFFDYNSYEMNQNELFQLGKKYENGNGVNKCLYIANELYYKAAIKGSKDAKKAIIINKLLLMAMPSYIDIKSSWINDIIGELEEKKDLGTGEEYRLLGFAYEDGVGKAVDYNKAISYYRRAVTMGTPSANNAIGDMYYYGQGVQNDYSQALNHYKMASDNGYATATCNLARCYENGCGVEKNDCEALRLYTLVADRGFDRGQLRCAIMHKEGSGTDANPLVAFSYCLKSAQQGNRIAQKLLGDIYLNGEGVEEDVNEALTWYCKSAEQEYSPAIERLETLNESSKIIFSSIDNRIREQITLILCREERLYWSNKFVRYLRREDTNYVAENDAVYNHDSRIIPYLMFVAYFNKHVFKMLSPLAKIETDIRATKWLEKGREINDAPSISMLGECFYNGIPYTDYHRAFNYFDEASQMCFHYATFLIGELYLNGKGVEKDVYKALTYFTIAANNNIGEAKNALGNLYLKGKDVEKDYGLALQNFAGVLPDNTTNKKLPNYAICNMGYMNQFGLGAPINTLKAIDLYLRADDEDGTSCCNLAWLAHNTDLCNDYNAVELYLKAIEKSNVRAGFNLALMNIKGDRIKKDYKKAFELLSKFEDTNSIHVKSLLAIAYLRGIYLKKDKKKARLLFKEIQSNNNMNSKWNYLKFLLFSSTRTIKKMDYLPNQSAPEEEIPFSGLFGLNITTTMNSEEKYYDIQNYIGKSQEVDMPYSHNARKLITRMFKDGVGGAPKSPVMEKYWDSYAINHPQSTSKMWLSENKKIEYSIINDEIEKKYNSLFGDEIGFEK